MKNEGIAALALIARAARCAPSALVHRHRVPARLLGLLIRGIGLVSYDLTPERNRQETAVAPWRRANCQLGEILFLEEPGHCLRFRYQRPDQRLHRRFHARQMTPGSYCQRRHRKPLVEGAQSWPGFEGCLRRCRGCPDTEQVVTQRIRVSLIWNRACEPGSEPFV